MTINVVIPVRLDSRRLPRKPLLDINGKSMVQRVYDIAVSAGVGDVVIATDSIEIQEHCQKFADNICMTLSEHSSGTERVAEVIDIMDYDDDDIVINLQGDEPLIPAELLVTLGEALEVHKSAVVATVATNITDVAEAFDPNVTKVVLNNRGHALYFSRAPIPYELENFTGDGDVATLKFKHLRHIGLYAYRTSFLKQYMLGRSSTGLALAESLEQLDIIYSGHKIFVQEYEDNIEKGVDTPEDLARVIDFIKQQEG